MQPIYGVSYQQLNMVALVYMLVFLPLNFPANYIIDRWGIRVGVTISALFTCVGFWIKCFINVSGFWTLMLGQFFAALGQPFILGCPAKVAQFWFNDKQRALATTIGSAANPLGSAIGFLLPMLFVTSKDPNSTEEQRRVQIFDMLFWEAVAMSVFFVLVLLLFRNKPETPPSKSQEDNLGRNLGFA